MSTVFRPALRAPCRCGAPRGAGCTGLDATRSTESARQNAVHPDRLLTAAPCPRCAAPAGASCTGTTRDAGRIHPERIAASPLPPSQEAGELARMSPRDQQGFLYHALPWRSGAGGAPWYRLVENHAECPTCGAGLGRNCKTRTGQLIELPHPGRYAAFFSACWPDLRAELVGRCVAAWARARPSARQEAAHV